MATMHILRPIFAIAPHLSNHSWKPFILMSFLRSLLSPRCSTRNGITPWNPILAVFWSNCSLRRSTRIHTNSDFFHMEARNLLGQFHATIFLHLLGWIYSRVRTTRMAGQICHALQNFSLHEDWTCNLRGFLFWHAKKFEFHLCLHKKALVFYLCEGMRCYPSWEPVRSLKIQCVAQSIAECVVGSPWVSTPHSLLQSGKPCFRRLNMLALLE